MSEQTNFDIWAGYGDMDSAFIAMCDAMDKPPTGPFRKALFGVFEIGYNIGCLHTARIVVEDAAEEREAA
jgi:hypothetical protein